MVELTRLACLKDETSRESSVCDSQNTRVASATDDEYSDTANQPIRTIRFSHFPKFSLAMHFVDNIVKQVLPKVIWIEHVATPHGKQWTRPLRVLLAVCNTHCRRIQSLSYGYATSFDDYHPHLIHPSLDRPHSPSQRHPDRRSRFVTEHFADRPTDRQTNRQTDRWSRRMFRNISGSM